VEDGEWVKAYLNFLTSQAHFIFNPQTTNLV